MTANANPLAGKPVPSSLLVNVSRLVTAYFSNVPDPAIAAQRVSFGTSGHRGSAFDTAFNEAHILAVAQAVCLQRHRAGIDGPLFLGMDTHALFACLLGYANDLGLLAEEYDPLAGRQLGNFPQAFSHVSLINTAHALSVDSVGASEQRAAGERDTVEG
ncbi:MAG TPA: glycoside hydrolase family 15 protein [Beijerinckiaceae bacterium]|nr:glycoside hydrolase family 15 protein [Beijerinckiaceae bacterium]